MDQRLFILARFNVSGTVPFYPKFFFCKAKTADERPEFRLAASAAIFDFLLRLSAYFAVPLPTLETDETRVER